MLNSLSMEEDMGNVKEVSVDYRCRVFQRNFLYIKDIEGNRNNVEIKEQLSSFLQQFGNLMLLKVHKEIDKSSNVSILTAYVEFSRKYSASLCITSIVEKLVLIPKPILNAKVFYGTNKPCRNLCQGYNCDSSKCKYIHYKIKQTDIAPDTYQKNKQANYRSSEELQSEHCKYAFIHLAKKISNSKNNIHKLTSHLMTPRMIGIECSFPDKIVLKLIRNQSKEFSTILMYHLEIRRGKFEKEHSQLVKLLQEEVEMKKDHLEVLLNDSCPPKIICPDTAKNSRDLHCSLRPFFNSALNFFIVDGSHSGLTARDELLTNNLEIFINQIFINDHETNLRYRISRRRVRRGRDKYNTHIGSEHN